MTVYALRQRLCEHQLQQVGAYIGGESLTAHCLCAGSMRSLVRLELSVTAVDLQAAWCASLGSLVG